MKIFNQILVIVLITTLAACSTTDSPKKIQTKQWLTQYKWKLSLESIVDKAMAQFPQKDQKKVEAQRIMMMAKLKEQLGDSFFEFKKNGQINTKLPYQGALTGTWKLSKDGNEILTKFNDHKSKMLIKSISADKLLIEVKNQANTKLLELEVDS